MKALVTGASGLVGSRIAEALTKAGVRVTWGSRSDLPNVGIFGGETALMDWENSDSLDKACQGMDVVIHAAAMNASDATVDPIGAHLVNGVASARLAMAAKEAKVKRLIYLSTAHVYKNPLIGKIDEGSRTNNPHPYAASKLAGEISIQQFAQANGLQILTLRLSNAIGAPIFKETKCWHLVAHDLCRQAVQNGSVELHTDGQQWRDFVTLQRVADVVIKMVHTELNLNSIKVLNVGGKPLRIIELAQLIRDRSSVYLGKEIEIYYKQPASSTSGVKLDYRHEKLKTFFSNYSISLEEAIDCTLGFCSEHF